MFGAIMLTVLVLGMFAPLGFTLFQERQARRRRLGVKSPDDPRLLASPGPQLAGKKCVECEELIVVAMDARLCKKCKAPVHKKSCARRHRALAHRAAAPTPYR